MTQFGTGSHPKVAAFLRALGLDPERQAIQRAIIDVKYDAAVKLYVTQVADVDAFDARLDAGEAEIMTAPKRDPVDATKMGDAYRSRLRLVEGPERFLRTPVRVEPAYASEFALSLVDADGHEVAGCDDMDLATALANKANAPVRHSYSRRQAERTAQTRPTAS